MTAQEMWRFDHQPEPTRYCSSAYQAGQSLWSTTPRQRWLECAHPGLDANRQVVFDIAYDTDGCQTS
jgi:hypothetical protein